MHGTVGNTDFATFKDKFAFRKEGGFLVGIEREVFLTKSGSIVPEAEKVLSAMTIREPKHSYSFELSKCQVEGHIGPCFIGLVPSELKKSEMFLQETMTFLGMKALYAEVAPDTIPLDVYPDPSGRYARIVQEMSQKVLRAACSCAGTHVHIGMPDHDTALKCYNAAVAACGRFIQYGDGSEGERMKLYKTVKPDFLPRSYESWEHFYEHAVEKKFANDPRSNWGIVRMSVHGTIEFRMFGATSDLNKVYDWARTCHALCKRAVA